MHDILLIFHFQAFPPETSFQNAISELVTKLVEQVKDATTKGYLSASDRIHELNHVAAGILSTFEEAAKTAVKPSMNKMIRIISDAVAQNKNITKCRADQALTVVKLLPEVFFTLMRYCVDSELSGAHDNLLGAKMSVSYYNPEIPILAGNKISFASSTCNWRLLKDLK